MRQYSHAASPVFNPYTNQFPACFQLLASCISQGFVAFLLYGIKSLKSIKPVSYTREPKTLGQHLRKRRLEQGLLQRDLRARFKLKKENYANWEKDRCYPAMNPWPGIIEFLGRDPNPKPTTLGERLMAYRRRYGLSREALSIVIGADEATLWRWENNQRKP
jgi:transcriptional regulator with XRE-family HTH domain